MKNNIKLVQKLQNLIFLKNLPSNSLIHDVTSPKFVALSPKNHEKFPKNKRQITGFLEPTSIAHLEGFPESGQNLAQVYPFNKSVYGKLFK